MYFQGSLFDHGFDGKMRGMDPFKSIVDSGKNIAGKITDNGGEIIVLFQYVGQCYPVFLPIVSGGEHVTNSVFRWIEGGENGCP